MLGRTALLGLRLPQRLLSSGQRAHRVRGMADLVGDEWRHFRWIEDRARDVCDRFGYQPIETPLVEEAGLFHRALGAGSDVVSKEMFSVRGPASDQSSSSSMVLRPEGTAGVCRFVAEQGTLSTQYGFFYAGAMFRYERPQRGRLRAFRQIGVEAIGGRNATLVDAQAIDCACQVLEAVGVDMSTVQLRINWLGAGESRRRYEAQLGDYLAGHVEALSADSRARVERGSYLRVLDSKDAGDAAVLAAAPSILDALTRESAAAFAQLQRLLVDVLRLPVDVVVDPRLVRGLDYYADTVFEFVSASDVLGPQQATLLAGGRYHDLVRSLAGPDLPGVGWAAGVERLALVTRRPDADSEPLAVVVLVDLPKDDAEQVRSPHGERLAAAGLQLSQQLRRRGVSVAYNPMGQLKRQLGRALAGSPYGPSRPSVAVFVKSDGNGAALHASVKDLRSHEETALPFDCDRIAEQIARIRQ